MSCRCSALMIVFSSSAWRIATTTTERSAMNPTKEPAKK